MTLYLPGAHIHRASDTAEAWLRPDGANVWVDVAHLQFNVPYRFRRSGGDPNLLMVLDAGPGKHLGSHGRAIRLPSNGSIVTLTRTSAGIYSVAGAATSYGGPFTARFCRPLVLGQSLASAWHYTDAAFAFDQRMIEHGFNLRPQTMIHAVGGAACEKRYDPDPPNRHWFNATTIAPGPLLSAAYNAVLAMPEKPDLVILHQGQQDSLIDPASATERAALKLAFFKVLDLIRAAINPGNRYAVPAFINFNGRVTSTGNPGGYQAVRDIQHDVIATWGASHNIHAGADTYDLPLSDVVHLTPEAAAEAGRRSADAYAVYLGKSDLRPRVIGHAIDGDTVHLTLSHAVSEPCDWRGLRCDDAAGNAIAVSVALAGTDLAITGSGIAKVMWPYDACVDMVPAAVPRANDRPLASFSISLT